MKRYFLFFVLISISLGLCAQDIELANEYFKQGEFEKAKEIYGRLARDKNSVGLIHSNYLQTLYKLKEWGEAEKFLKRQIKANEQFLTYRADYALMLEMTGRVDDSQKELNSLIDLAARNEGTLYEIQDFLFKNNKAEQVIQLLKKARELARDDNKYAIFFARAYLYNGQKEPMIDEMLKYGLNEGNSDYVKATFQDNLKTEAEVELLEKALYSKVQKFPNEQYYLDILIWHLVQQKEFYKAFVQTRALDRRFKQEGQKVFELAQMALINKDFKNAILMYEYVMKEYPQGQFYPYARRNAIFCKEEVIKTTYPVDLLQIRGLIKDYNNLFTDLGRNQKTMEAMRNTAQLYAFYLNEKDTAIAVLEKAISIAGNDIVFRDKCKLDLGDIYILKNEPWEATLLYSQVEKSQKEDFLGQEAKLKNAKLHYYNGLFDLSKEVLDILKKATTREIANDAMQLSLLIQDNTGLDSTEAAMKEYAAIDLLLFQNKNQEALAALESAFQKYKSHSLADEILWLRANTYLKTNQPNKALDDLEFLRKNYNYDILADDALYLEAKIYQENLGQKDKAMELYREILQNFPGSIYSADARRRFRILRGDAIN
ncbi:MULTISPECIES: tetratricopeptide repeat protein [Emticicia]|uniref:tetratricopeptide repeat protein n=1 Tax=Emticicia TaxID=312278 RepID=UPI00209F05B3|nr:MULTISPECIES: tetratricopeptide repeat protein [Emticicia]UTA68202.1 tetratricopeptide repeat protein [Emticicia sp. 21SJ11W-3]